MMKVSTIFSSPPQSPCPKQAQTEPTFTRIGQQQLQQSSVTRHFRQFLQQHSSQYPNRKRPCTSSNKNNRMNVNSQLKKSSIYRKLLNMSVNKDNIGEEMNRYKIKFEHVRKEHKDLSSIVFREIWEEEQKKKYQQDVRKAFENKMIAMHLNKKERQNKSFEHFLEDKKKRGKINSCFEVANLTTDTIGCEKSVDSTKLVISGNHKEIKKKTGLIKKDKDIGAKTRSMKKQANTTVPSTPHGLSPQKQKEKQIQNVLQSNQTKQEKAQTVVQTIKSESKEQKTEDYRPVAYKNIFSPFNGIQIKYLSSQQQQLVVSSSKKVPQKHALNIPLRMLLRKRNSPAVDSRSIVFRTRSTGGQYQGVTSIDGWKVSQEHGEDDSLYS